LFVRHLVPSRPADGFGQSGGMAEVKLTSAAGLD
jgi:hypothetical protein